MTQARCDHTIFTIEENNEHFNRHKNKIETS